MPISISSQVGRCAGESLYAVRRAGNVEFRTDLTAKMGSGCPSINPIGK